MRPFFIGIPVRDLALVHLKAIMMLCNRNNIFCSCRLKKLRPLPGIKVFCPEHRDKILITKFGMLSIGFNVMLIFCTVLHIHISGIPLICKGRHAENSPVDKNPEFGLPVPFRNLICRQGMPVILIRPLLNYLINGGKIWF